jgi:DHA1 family multidrug resistance protein-like MFS transporter
VLAEVFGMRMSFFLAAGALFCSFLMFVFFIKEPPASVRAMAEMRQKAKRGQKEKQPDVWSMPLLRDMMLAGTIVQMVILILQPILTNYITMLAGDLPNLIFIAGLVFSLGGFAGAMSAPVWGKLGQKRGFFRMLTIAMLLAGLVMIVQGMPDTLVPFAVCQFVGGLFFSGIQPSSRTHWSLPPRGRWQPRLTDEVPPGGKPCGAYGFAAVLCDVSANKKQRISYNRNLKFTTLFLFCLR